VKLKALRLIFIGTMATVALAQDLAEVRTKEVRTKIVALEKAWNQAYKLGDAHALGDILDNEIVLINDDGSTQDKRDFLATVRASKPQEQQVAPESIEVHLFGDTAVASGVFRAKGVEGGKPYIRRERFVDTWIFKKGKWVCVATNATPIVH
jgi:ketosteroid isomerase-like protein